MVKRITAKAIVSGNVIEIFEYSEGYLKGFKNDFSKNLSGRKENYKSEDYGENRKQVLRRGKSNLRRLINANHSRYGKGLTTKFMTLTFAENIKDLTMANYEFKKFILRLNYLATGTKRSTLKYSCVVEFQERGAIHYHIVFYNLPYIKHKELLKCWGNDRGLRINKIDNVDNVGTYIASYLGDPKKNQGRASDDSRLEARKSYFSSRGLFKPIEITDKKKVESLVHSLPIENKVFSDEYENEYLGQISYKQYRINI